MSQNFPVNKFEWVKCISKFDESFIKSYDEESCVIHIRNLKKPLTHGLVLKKAHQAIKFHQKAWLK